MIVGSRPVIVREDGGWLQVVIPDCSYQLWIILYRIDGVHRYLMSRFTLQGFYL
jgi:hypothetical protein